MGTYATFSTVRSSDPVCRKISDIVLLSEKLYINLTSGASEVKVKYLLWNRSDTDYTDIDYAFPIDYMDGPRVWGGTNPAITGIAFKCDGRELEFAHSEDSAIPKTGIPLGMWDGELFYYPDEEDTGDEPALREYIDSYYIESELYRRWYYTRFSVGRQAVVELEVNYRLMNQSLCDGDSPLIHEFGFCTGRRLVYDFSPAVSWGDGIIRDFYAEIDGRDLLLAGDRFDAATGDDLLRVSGLDFTHEGTRLVYRMRNFDLREAPPLVINYSSLGLNSYDFLRNFLVPAGVYSVRSSGGTESYPASNLGDLDLETAWVGKGTGDWIEFTFDGTVPLAGFCILNGYHKSAGTYISNNRVRKLRMELWDPDGNPVEWWGEYLTLEDAPYRPVYLENLFHHAFYYDFHDVEAPLGKIRLTVEEVFPGSLYDDTCISEILFLR